VNSVRRAQRRSRLAEGHRAGGFGLDRREHGASVTWAGLVVPETNGTAGSITFVQSCAWRINLYPAAP
jgi:hypothetical protein